MAKLEIFPDASALAAAAADHVVKTIRRSVASRGQCYLALSGGSTPHQMHRQLTQVAGRFRIPWERTHIFWGDERCVPLDHPDSNYHMAKESLLDDVPLKPEQVYAIAGDLDANAEADRYEQILQQHFPNGDWPVFDLVILGLGPDGHTASLFPNHPALTEQQRWVVPISNAPKPPPERITLSLPVINAAHRVMFLVNGSSKSDALYQVLEENDQALPASRIRPQSGELHWFIDQTAATRLHH